MKRVLCPVDYSMHSRRAAQYASAIAGRFGATVTGLHVLETVPILTNPGEGLYPPVTFTVNDLEQFRQQLDGFMHQNTSGCPVDAVVLQGSIAAEIVRFAQELHADVITVGSHGRTGFDRLLLGSTTEKLLRKASCPLLVVPAHAPEAPAPTLFQRILCAVDFSPASLHALALAGSLARATNAMLTVVHVLEPRSVFAPVPSGAWGSSITAEEIRATAERRLQETIAREPMAHADRSVVVTGDKAYREILRAAADGGSDLIVIGTHGGALGTLAFGSTTNHVVRAAECAVLTVPA